MKDNRRLTVDEILTTSEGPGVRGKVDAEVDQQRNFVIAPDQRVLITGAAGFIGNRVLERLLDRGFRNLVCLVRPSSNLSRLRAVIERRPAGAQIKLVTGNLLSRQDCEEACKDVSLVLHLAAGVSEKSFPNAVLNSVVTTRNLLDGCARNGSLTRFVLVSSFAVYSNRQKRQWRILDESCPVEEHPEQRGEAYCFAKVKQEELLREYGKNLGVPYVVVRPGSVYGEGKAEITGRVGLGTFGLFLHLGGSNPIPFTYVDNCAEAIVLAGLVPGVEGEAFNIVDDDLPSSRQFLWLHKRSVRRFRSIYVPHFVSYALCYLWERYSHWSEGQLPPVFNRNRWHAYWKKTRYSNRKLKSKLGWVPIISTSEALKQYFAACGQDAHSA
jgi:nucleoside-diphosphate-sugar epimerase